MRRAMSKPRDMLFKRFTAQVTEINNFLPLFPGLDTAKIIPPEEPNEILLHAVNNGQDKKYHLQ